MNFFASVWSEMSRWVSLQYRFQQTLLVVASSTSDEKGGGGRRGGGK